jgi:methionine-rich copper-binding protein CopC
MKKIYSLLILLAACVLTGTQAQAHAFLDHARPRVGSTVATSPPQVKIWFTEELEGAFSRIEVFDAKGAEVDRKDSKIDPANGAIMTVSLPPLGPGEYQVKWSAVATDTHPTTGTFIFTVKSP